MQDSSEVQRSRVSYHFNKHSGDLCRKNIVGFGSQCKLVTYKQLRLGELKPTTITLYLADRSVKIPKGIVEDVLVKVDKFYYPVDFVVLDTELVAT